MRSEARMLTDAMAFQRHPTFVPAVKDKAQSASSDNPLVRFFGVIADPAAWSALLYMSLSLATGVIYFTLAVTALSLSAGMMILIIGVPVAVMFLAAIRATSFFEGLIVESLLGVRMPRRPPVAEDAGGRDGVVRRVKSWLSDRQTWTTLLYMLLMLPLGIVYFTLAIVALALSVSAATAPIAWAVFPAAFGLPPDRYLHYYVYFHRLDPWSSLLVVAAGILGLIATLWMAKGIGSRHAQFAKAMLTRPVEADSDPASDHAA